MKRIVFALTFLLATSSAAWAQFAPSKESLRGLTGVRLIVMFNAPTRAEAFDEVQRPGVLKLLEADTKAKLEKAGIPFSHSQFADRIGEAGNPRLIVLVKLDQPKGFETEVKLIQSVQLSRDPSIETDAVTWSLGGGGNKGEIEIVRRQVASLIDRFIEDYLSKNSKQSASSGKEKSKNPKR